MKPLYQLLFAVCSLSACTSKDDPNAIQKFTGVCKEKSDMYISITQNGVTRTSVHDNIGIGHIIFLGGADSILRVMLDIDAANSQPSVMIDASVPAGTKPGIYHADSTNLVYEKRVALITDQKRYYSTDLQLIISTLGNYKLDTAYGIREYAEAAGSFSGSFTADGGGQPINVSGEFCVDFDGEKK